MRHALVLACAVLACGPATATPTHEAVRQVGTAYHYGGRSPQTGFDCSGLVAHAFEEAWGLELPRTAQGLAKAGRAVRRADLRPGDLVFYNTRNRPFSHVGIYIGEGRFVHAPRRGAKVRIESLETRYWRSRFNGARRLEPPSAQLPPAGGSSARRA